MVLRLAEVLDVPLRDRNRLLQVAGFGPAYPHTTLKAAELEPYRSAIERLLAAHEPFPGMVLDGHANVVAANRAASLLFGSGLVGCNMIERYLTDQDLRQSIVNWPQVAWAALERLRRQSRQAPLDERLRALTQRAEEALPAPHDTDVHSLVACPWFRVGDTVIRTVTLAARFDTALEVTLEELRIELVYPQDAAAERFFRSAPLLADGAEDAVDQLGGRLVLP